MSLKKNDSFFKRKKLSNLFSFYPMPNYIYSILRVFGEKEERQKFIEYTSKIVPSQYRLTHPLNPNEKIPAMMDKWYEYQTWENEKGWPNHCGKWEFSPDDAISEKTEKDKEIINWMNKILPIIQIVSNKETAAGNFRRELAEKCNNDPNEIKRIIDLFQNQPEEDACNEMSDRMSPCFANDNYFKLTEEELINAPDIPQCTKTWEFFKHHSQYREFDSDDDDDY